MLDRAAGNSAPSASCPLVTVRPCAEASCEARHIGIDRLDVQ